jgi:glucose dehydrogenase
MAPNIIGLGLVVAGVIFMIIGGIVFWIIGAICLLGGVAAMWMTWQRKRHQTS